MKYSHVLICLVGFVGQAELQHRTGMVKALSYLHQALLSMIALTMDHVMRCYIQSHFAGKFS